MSYKNIILHSKRKEGIFHIQLHRPKVLNSLNSELMHELTTVLKELDVDKTTRAIVISGDEKSFAAGADIKEMAQKGTMDMFLKDPFAGWDQIPKVKTPLIAAVSGYALGGGCELAMMCDLIVASETALLGQPEIKLGVIPGVGGTQRLTHALGKARAMELILTGEPLHAKDALKAGLINKIYPVDSYLKEALKLAEQIAAMPPLAVKMAKEAVLNSYEMSLEDSLRMERKNFYMLFDSKDQKEGMQAFIEKRAGKFKGK